MDDRKEADCVAAVGLEGRGVDVVSVINGEVDPRVLLAGDDLEVGDVELD
jgi:hypothetical protein